MRVHPANHNHPIGSILLFHVPAFRQLPTIPDPPEPDTAADRTLMVEKSKAPIRSPRSPVQGSRLGPGRQIVGKAPNASFRVSQTRPQAEEDPTSMSVSAKPPYVSATGSMPPVCSTWNARATPTAESPTRPWQHSRTFYRSLTLSLTVDRRCESSETDRITFSRIHQRQAQPDAIRSGAFRWTLRDAVGRSRCESRRSPAGETEASLLADLFESRRS